jgi:membrane associated rhomboid family serine protease
MFILPISKKPDWRRPPIVTLLLILSNCLVFFAAQSEEVVKLYAFTPAEHAPVTFFTHMFLHGNVEHLLGNMVVLFAVGYAVEEVLGGWRLLLFYLLSGIFAVNLFWLLNLDSTQGLVGASGAISGVMGMYTVLFGLKRIDFFYSIIIYFDFVKAPAIVLLPLWLANELLQQWWFPDSPVAYMAHVGGLLAGAGLAALGTRRRAQAGTVSASSKDASEDPKADVERVQRLIKALQFDKARTELAALINKRPHDRNLVTQFYNLAKLKPGSEDYHHAAARIFELDDDAASLQLLQETFYEYLRLTKADIRLSADQLVLLARRFIRNQRPAEAERTIDILLSQYQRHEQLPTVMMRLALAYESVGDMNRSKYHQQRVLELFPNSAEAGLVRGMLI